MNAIERFNFRYWLASKMFEATCGVILAIVIAAAWFVGLSVEQWLHPSYLPV